MAVSRKRRPSPLLGAVANSIGEATNSLVTPASRFAHTFEAPLDRVSPDPDQPRKSFDPDGLASLASTMSDQGQLQPILCLLYTSPSPRDLSTSRMPSSA